MSASMFIAVCAAATVAAYVCRFERLTWLRQPLLTAAHWVGAVLALWVLTDGARGDASAANWVLLGASVAVLALLYTLLPEHESQPHVLTPAPVKRESMRHVSGGSAASRNGDEL